MDKNVENKKRKNYKKNLEQEENIVETNIKEKTKNKDTKKQKIEEKTKNKDKKKQKIDKDSDSGSNSEEIGDDAHINSTDTKKFREEHNIKITGTNSDNDKYKPYPTFDLVSKIFSKDILASTKGFTKPTPIQAQCWPVVLDGRDIIAIAETGSGKTLAFLLPGLVYIKRLLQQNPETNKKHNRYPKILVVSPTRELAMQTAQVCTAASQICGLTTLCVYGGVDKSAQARELKGNVDILIATPGRLLDLFNDQLVVLSDVSYLVLDEADRMLDMGFEKDIRSIISQCKSKPASKDQITAIGVGVGGLGKYRQTLMYSATWPTSIQALAKEFLFDSIHVSIGSLELSANHRVTQHVEVLDPFAKDRKLEELLKKYHGSRKNKVIVFALYKKEASRIEENLNRRGWNCLAIHGDKSQQQRSAAIESFKNGSQPLLIATDVAARGLDIPDVEYVINYTFPLTIEDYVHRIGRTGRAGKVGVSHTLFTLHDKAHAGELINVLKEANQIVPEGLTQWGTHTKKKEHSLYGNHFKNVDLNTKSSHTKFSLDD